MRDCLPCHWLSFSVPSASSAQFNAMLSGPWGRNILSRFSGQFQSETMLPQKIILNASHNDFFTRF